MPLTDFDKGMKELAGVRAVWGGGGGGAVSTAVLAIPACNSKLPLLPI